MYVDKYINMCMPLAMCEKVLIFKLIFSMSTPFMSATFSPKFGARSLVMCFCEDSKNFKVTRANTLYTGKQKSVQIECVSLSLAGAL